MSRSTSRQEHRPSGRRASSEVPIWLSLLLAAPTYGLALLATELMPKAVRVLLLERGWVPHAIMILTCLALVILTLKAVGLAWQRRGFALELFSADVGRISRENVGQVIDHVQALRAASGSAGRRRSFLFERVLRNLEHFAARGDAAETAAVNSAECDSDAASVAGSFSLIKVLVWAIPILGFIGTVIGISDAVEGFSQSLRGAAELDSIKSSLRSVTGGLAVAFDTTLVALVASIIVMLPTSRLQRAEEQLVDDVDDYCVTRVLRALSTEPPPPAASTTTSGSPVSLEDLRQVIAGMLAPALTGLLETNALLASRLGEDRELLREARVAMREQLGAFAVSARYLGPTLERATHELSAAARPGASPVSTRAAGANGTAHAKAAPGASELEE